MFMFTLQLHSTLLLLQGFKGTNCCYVQVAFSCVIYPCLILQYMGQAAFLSRNLAAVSMSFYASVPGKLLKDVKESSKGLITVLYFFQAFISLRIIIIIRLKECSFLLRSSTNLACTCGCSSCRHCCQSTCYLFHILNFQAMSCNTMFPTCQGCYKQTDPRSVIHP